MINTVLAGSYSPPELSVFYSHQRDLTGFKTGISFSSAGDVGRTKFAKERIVTRKGQAEPQVRDYLLQKAAQPRMSACFLIGLKASKAQCMTPWLKKMRLVSEGRGGQLQRAKLQGALFLCHHA
jgi:hypothetical protein